MYTKSNFAKKLVEAKSIPLSGTYTCYAFVVQVNEENFPNMSESLVTQLKREGKYGWWVSSITDKPEPPYSNDYLPVYGNSGSWELKWLRQTPIEAARTTVKDKWADVVNRANTYLIENTLTDVVNRDDNVVNITNTYLSEV